MIKRFGCMVAIGLITAQMSYADDGLSDRGLWGSLGLKYWNYTYTPSGGYSSFNRNDIFPTLTLGYDRVFLILNSNGVSQNEVSGLSTPGGTLRFHEGSYGFGYVVSPNVSVAYGNKGTREEYFNPATGQSYTYKSIGFQTVTAILSWTIPERKEYLFGNLSYGRGSATDVMQDNLAYKAYEFGIGYPVLDWAKISVGYRNESFDLPYATSLTALQTNLFGPSTWQTGTQTRSGLFTNVSFTF